MGRGLTRSFDGAPRALVVAMGLLAISATRAAVRYVPPTIESARRLIALDGEGRRRIAYGDCDVRGYGYVRRVTDGIPRDRGRPRVRNADESYPSDVVLPEDDWNRETRVVIGIGFDEPAFLESLRAKDGPSFAIVHRSGACFTAVAPEILREGENAASPWHAWLARLRSMP